MKSYSASMRGKRRLQARFAVLHIDHFDFGAGQFAVGRHHVVVAAGRTLTRDLPMSASPEQHVVDRARQRALVDAAAHGRVALRIEIDQQYALLRRRQAGGKIDAGGGLADAAFLVRDRENFCHGAQAVSNQMSFSLQVQARAMAAPAAPRSQPASCAISSPG